mgnify:FL=1
MAYNTIKLKNYSDVIVEYEAYETIYPGMLVEPRSGYSTIQKHATAGDNAIPMIALEDSLQGKDILDAYVAGDIVKVWIPGRGDEGYVLLADEENVAIGDFLESNGDGYFRKHVAQEASGGSAAAEVSIKPLRIVAQALEALDLSSLSVSESESYPTRQFLRVRFV